MTAHRLAAFVSIGVVGIAVAAGLYIAGSPAEQRLLRLDARRVADLQRLASVTSTYYTETANLPVTLGELVDGRRLSRLPRDPVSEAPYEYRTTGTRRFELCAEFSRESPSEAGQDFWSHGQGRECFEFDFSDLDSN